MRRGSSNGGCAIAILAVLLLLFNVVIPNCSSPDSKTDSTNSRESLLTGAMDGNAWKSASTESRQALAANISKRLNDGSVSDCSASFIYDALNSFYSSKDQSILSQKISEIVGLSVSAAKTLTQKQRNY